MSIASDFCHLPTEILGTIFSFLPSNSVARCERVCKVFQQSINQESVWNALLKRDFRISPEADFKLNYQNEMENAKLIVAQLNQFIQRNRLNLDIVFHSVSARVSAWREWVSSNPGMANLLLHLIIKKSEEQSTDYSEIIRFLLNMGAPIDYFDAQLREIYPQHLLSNNLFSLSIKTYHRKPDHCTSLLKILFDYGMKIIAHTLELYFESEIDGKLALYLTDLFIERGIQLTDGELNAVIKHSFPEVVEIVDKLLNQGIIPSESTLIEACKNDSPYGCKLVSKLLQTGAPVTQRVLQETSHSQFKDLLLKYRSKVLGNWLLRVIAYESLEDSPNIMRTLLSRKGHTQEQMSNALWIAIKNPSSQGTEMMRLLLQAGVQLEHFDLVTAIQESSVERVKILLKHNVPFNESSLRLAAENTSNSALEMVSALLDAGCPVSSDAIRCAELNPSPQSREIISLLITRSTQQSV